MPKLRRRKVSRRPEPLTPRSRGNHVQSKAEELQEAACYVKKFGQSHGTLIATTEKALSICLQTHCQKYCPAYPFDASKFLPTRLLDVQKLEGARLVNSAGIKGRDRRYVCLSHQWGNPPAEEKLAMTTLARNLQMRQDGIDFRTLPKRYQEAMTICQLMGVRYLWIDSLCILQDSQEDWKHESSMMSRVYECALFTIASNMPVDGQKWKVPRPHEWISRSDRQERSSSWLSEMLLKGPLAKRAWCLQERYVSPRILHVFAGKIWIWECDSRVRAANKGGLLFRHDVIESNLNWRRTLIANGLDRNLLTIWYKAVQDFSARNLSYETDKLPAISGIAAKLQPRLRCKYLAGIWETDLFELFWCRLDKAILGPLPYTYAGHYERDERIRQPSIITPSSYRAPSWSWASVDSPVKFDGLGRFDRSVYASRRRGDLDAGGEKLICLALLESSNMLSNEAEPLGQVMEGSYITLRGYIWDPRYATWGSLVSFDHRPEDVTKPIFYFILYCRLSLSRHIPQVLGLILSKVGPNTYRRIGVFDSSLEQLMSSMISQGVYTKFKDVGADDIPALFAPLGGKVEITLI